MSKEDKLHWNMAKNKGSQLRYQLGYDQQGKLWCYCKNSKAYCKLTFSQRVAKHVIHHSDGSKRYMTQSDIEGYLLLQHHFEVQDTQDINIRPNVEATIHQVFHRLLKRNKVKYRGKYKCSLYVLSRALWTNFRRILKNEITEAALWLFFLFCPWKGHPWDQKRTFYCCFVKQKLKTGKSKKDITRPLITQVTQLLLHSHHITTYSSYFRVKKRKS